MRTEFARFIVAETPRGAERVLRELWNDGVATSVDLLGEATVTAAEADRYADRCADALRSLSAIYAKLPERPALESRSAGQKLLMRMGPDNAAVIKKKLRELKTFVTTSQDPPKGTATSAAPEEGAQAPKALPNDQAKPTGPAK